MGGIRINKSLTIPEGELDLRFSRSGGPGGQNVNTRDTKVEVVFDVAGSPSLRPRQRERALRNLAGRLDSEGRLHVAASDARTQAQNRDAAIARLRASLAEALRPDPAPRRPTKPSRAAKQRRLDAKRRRSRTKRLRSSIPDD